jgi:hypothetical protein
MADVVLWSRDPFSVYAQAEQVYVDGALTYDRRDRRYQPRSDFELGQAGQSGVDTGASDAPSSSHRGALTSRRCRPRRRTSPSPTLG